MSDSYQCTPRLAALSLQFNGGTSFSWNGFGIASVVRSAAGTYDITFQSPRHFAECTQILSVIGDGSIKGTLRPFADGYSGVTVLLVGSAAGNPPTDTGFSFSQEPLPPTGGAFLSGPFPAQV